MPDARYFSMPSIEVGGNGRRVTDHGHQLAVAAGLRPQHAESILDIVEGDALDEARQHFVGRWCCRRL
jgi:hypothetical protein